MTKTLLKRARQAIEKSVSRVRKITTSKKPRKKAKPKKRKAPVIPSVREITRGFGTGKMSYESLHKRVGRKAKAKKFTDADLRAAKAARDRKIEVTKRMAAAEGLSLPGAKAGEYELVRGKNGYRYELKEEAWEMYG